MRQWLLDPGSIYKAIRLSDPLAQRQLIARASEIGKSWSEFSGPRQRAFVTALIERVDIRTNRVDILLRPTRLGALLDVAPPLPSGAEDQAEILSVPAELRRCGREIKMLINATDRFATAKPDARLIKLLIRAQRFNTALLGSDGVPFLNWPSAKA